MDKDTMRVLVFEPGKEPYIKDIGRDLKSLQKEVGGLIETFYPSADEICIVCNEEGKINGLPLNRSIKNDDGERIEIMAGTFFIAGLSEDSFDSLSEEHILKYADMYRQPENFMKINGNILAVPYSPEDKKPSIKQQLATLKSKSETKSDIPKNKNLGGESL